MAYYKRLVDPSIRHIHITILNVWLLNSMSSPEMAIFSWLKDWLRMTENPITPKLHNLRLINPSFQNRHISTAFLVLRIYLIPISTNDIRAILLSTVTLWIIQAVITFRLVPDIKMSLSTKVKFLSYLLQLVCSTLDTCTEAELRRNGPIM